MSAPKNVKLNNNAWDSVTLSWGAVENTSKESIKYRVEMKIEGENGSDFIEVYNGTETKFTKEGLLADNMYVFRIRTVRGSSVSKWSDVIKRTQNAPDFSECIWKECLDYVDEGRKYSVDKNNPRIATFVGDYYCTIIGNAPIPLNRITSWNIKILNSKRNDGCSIYIGVAPSDIDQNDGGSPDKCGWYFYCYHSAIFSGPPHNYDDKLYGPKKEKWGEYIHTGDTVGVVMDTTTNGELSFIVNGVNYGVAYKGIPLDKPLVPCVLLCNEDDSVELDTSKVKEYVDISIPVPSNIIAKSITWDSITLTWGAVEGAEFYQIELDGNKSWYASTTNSFSKMDFFPETGHNFRVRTVKGNSVSEWSEVVKGKTQKAPDFSECIWKDCPDYVNKDNKYSVDENNPRIAINNSDFNYCTIIGNTSLPLNKVTSWNIKILKSKDNNGRGIYIGVAPFDINQNNPFNYNDCGWYFSCYNSSLCSGPPHNYKDKEYGPRKENGGEYVKKGDSVGVVMDTTKGELSFAVNGVNLGVAYEGIPLDKPLVPCVLLKYEGDSVDLVI